MLKGTSLFSEDSTYPNCLWRTDWLAWHDFVKLDCSFPCMPPAFCPFYLPASASCLDCSFPFSVYKYYPLFSVQAAEPTTSMELPQILLCQKWSVPLSFIHILFLWSHFLVCTESACLISFAILLAPLKEGFMFDSFLYPRYTARCPPARGNEWRGLILLWSLGIVCHLEIPTKGPEPFYGHFGFLHILPVSWYSHHIE